MYGIRCLFLGVWAPSVGELADVTVPLVPMKHAYVVTEKIEGIRQMPNVRDHDFSVYFKLQGDALCIGGYEPNPHFIDKIDDDFAFSLYELDWDIFTTNIEGHVKRIPVIESTGIKVFFIFSPFLTILPYIPIFTLTFN